MKQLTENEIYGKLKGKLFSSQINWGDGVMAIQVCYDGTRATDQKIVNFLMAQGFKGQGIEKLMGMRFEWLRKEFRPMTDEERMLA